MESELSYEKVTFDGLQVRLLKLVNTRIHNGEYTERGLARILGISQSQLHNVLKGARKLHLDLADRFLAKFGLTLLDLFGEHELEEALRVRRGAVVEYYVLSGRVERSSATGAAVAAPAAPVSVRSAWRKPAARSDSYSTSSSKNQQRKG